MVDIIPQNILAIETSTAVCSVALQTKDGKIISRFSNEVGAHSEKAVLFIREIFEECNLAFDQIQEIIINKGPGSYTGLRIGASLVKGLVFDKQVTFTSADGLAAIAYSLVKKNPRANSYHAVVNARRTHLYHQIFTYDATLNLLNPQNVASTRPINLVEESISEGDVIGGDGAQRLEKLNKATYFNRDEIVSAEALLSLKKVSNGSKFLKTQHMDVFEPIYKLPEISNKVKN